LQTDVFDKLFIGLIPLLITLGTLYLLKNKRMKSTTVLFILILVGAVCGVLRIF
jgi:mannose/fructose/N-acetylgalactosamine-specific phosphotransferase system component IID